MSEKRPSTPRLTVGQINVLLGVNLWDAPSFRADLSVDFDEFGHVLAVRLLNPRPEAKGSTSTFEGGASIPGISGYLREVHPPTKGASRADG